jgi:hypothetical protein
MPKRTKDQNTLALGDWNALCDVCGMKFKASDLREQWDGDKRLMVCKDDWEPRHPSEFFRPPKADISVPWERPDDAGAGGTNYDGETVPPTYTHTIVGNDPDSDDDGVPDLGTFTTNNTTL